MEKPVYGENTGRPQNTQFDNQALSDRDIEKPLPGESNKKLQTT